LSQEQEETVDKTTYEQYKKLLGNKNSPSEAVGEAFMDLPSSGPLYRLALAHPKLPMEMLRIALLMEPGAWAHPRAEASFSGSGADAYSAMMLLIGIPSIKNREISVQGCAGLDVGKTPLQVCSGLFLVERWLSSRALLLESRCPPWVDRNKHYLGTSSRARRFYQTDAWKRHNLGITYDTPAALNPFYAGENAISGFEAIHRIFAPRLAMYQADRTNNPGKYSRETSLA